MQQIYKILFFSFLLGQCVLVAQEKELDINVEESAEVFLEQFSDDFQESFFEALKQKGIGNQDRAINLLLKCKKLDANNVVVDHELAKAYLANRQFNLAKDYGLVPLKAEPENLWYLNTYVSALQKQGLSFQNEKHDGFANNTKLQENLAVVYYRKRKYESALAVLKNLQKTPFLADLESKIDDSIKKRDKKRQNTSFTAIAKSDADPALNYKTQIEGLIRTNNYMMLKQVAEEALETYPSQPFFYYAQGLALNNTNKQRDAVEVLEAALDYLVGDIKLANKIYTQLAEAYNGINNSVKANMYLRKIKPGF